MVEVMEYALVVLASSLFAGASVALLGSFRSFEGASASQSAFAEVAGLAWQAVENGSASAAMQLGAGSVSCSRGHLTLATGASSRSADIPAACSFSVSFQAGVHRVGFSFADGILTAKVS